jgi:hypothetical protein
MGTFGKHASSSTSLGLTAAKRKSTGKLNSLSRTSRHPQVCITQMGGRTLPYRSASTPLSPSIFMTTQQKIGATDLPPSIPRRGISATDLPPSIPRRILSRSSRVHIRANDYDDGIGEQGQQNAVFGQTDMTKPRHWDQKERCLDRCPSYNRTTSVSALNAFANISIKSKPSLSTSSASNNPSSIVSQIDAAPIMLEVSPGILARLRDAHETWTYLQRDFYLPASCKGCSVELTCIKNLDYVLCPTCRTVSPIDGPQETRGGGLGLGFTVDDLRRWETGKQLVPLPSPSAALEFHHDRLLRLRRQLGSNKEFTHDSSTP